MEKDVHKRYLEYRELCAYFGKKQRTLGAEEFAALDDEHRKLFAKGDARDDEEDARFAELVKLLHRD